MSKGGCQAVKGTKNSKGFDAGYTRYKTIYMVKSRTSE